MRLLIFLIIWLLDRFANPSFVVLQVESRNLDHNLDSADYHSLTAILNYKYTQTHGAVYRYYAFNDSQYEFAADLQRIYNETIELSPYARRSRTSPIHYLSQINLCSIVSRDMGLILRVCSNRVKRIFDGLILPSL